MLQIVHLPPATNVHRVDGVAVVSLAAHVDVYLIIHILPPLFLPFQEPEELPHPLCIWAREHRAHHREVAEGGLLLNHQGTAKGALAKNGVAPHLPPVRVTLV